MGGLTSLGFLMGGTARGLQDAQQMSESQARIELEKTRAAHENEIMQRQRQAWGLQDAMMKDQEAARSAQTNILDQDRAAYDANAAQLANPQGPPTEAGVPPAALSQAPYQVGDKLKLKAVTAQADELARRGRMKEATEVWASAEKMRSDMRGLVARKVDAALATGADPTKALQEWSDAFDNGMDVVGVTPTTTKDGAKAFSIKQRNRLSGSDMPDAVMTPEEIMYGIAKVNADPKTAAQMSISQYHDMATEAVKKRNQEAADERARKRQEAADTRADRRVGAEAAKPFSLGPDETRFDAKGNVIATGKSKTAGDQKRDQLWVGLNTEIVKVYGTPAQGFMGGNRIDNEYTAAAADFARDIMRSDPKIDQQAARRKAVKAMKGWIADDIDSGKLNPDGTPNTVYTEPAK